METRLKKLLAGMETTDWENLSEAERSARKEDLLTQIAFFQHERLIHLIVTALVAVLTMLGLMLLVIQPTIAEGCLEAIFAILLVAYIRHYYILENGVQKLYIYYDRSAGTFSE